MRRRDFLLVFAGGIAAATPLMAHAQQAMPTGGGVSGAASRRTSLSAEPFVQSMKELGWEDGRNYRALFLWAEGHSDRFTGLVSELIAQRVSVIVVLGNPALEAARRATATIPIIGISDDMVQSGFATSMAQPGGNITGVSIFASSLNVKRLELLHEAIPVAKRIGVLADPTTIFSRPELEEAAQKLNLELIMFNARNPEELVRSLDAVKSARIDSVNVLASPFLCAS